VGCFSSDASGLGDQCRPLLLQLCEPLLYLSHIRLHSYVKRCALKHASISLLQTTVPAVQGYYTLMAWLPSYFELALGLDVQNSSLLTLIPYLAMTAMTPFVSLVSALGCLILDCHVMLPMLLLAARLQMG